MFNVYALWPIPPPLVRHFTLLTVYVMEAPTTSQPGPRFTGPVVRASFNFIGNFSWTARAHPLSPTRSPHFLKLQASSFPNNSHTDQKMDLRKERLGIQETFKTRLLSVVPATTGVT